MTDATTRAAAAYQPLAPHASLWVARSACLPGRFPRIACDACIGACPTGALSWSAETSGAHLQLSGDACVQCGRCVAACPTHALTLPGLQVVPPDPARAEVHLDCLRVPQAESPEGTVRVPCLGGLKTSQWLALAANGAAVRYLDRGWCSQCSAGGQKADLPALDAALTQLAGAAPDLPGIQRLKAPLPHGLRQGEAPDPGLTRTVNRRGFLRQLAGQVANASQAIQGDEAARPSLPMPDGTRRIRPSERLAQFTVLTQMARDQGHQSPPLELAHAHIDPQRCHDHGICARACPTAALSTYRDADERGIRFDPVTCIQCGECQALCPEQAIEIRPAWPEDANPATPRTLTRHGTRRCGECGQDFPCNEHELSDEVLPLCPQCQKGRGLFETELHRLFGMTP
ncbi:MAG: 4Fe-4S dicluster domain-containing protein [Chromatiaceae bacterium]|nr:MAG: 4Fe-4S dicluster domain-containing protein [Chromatiaceae bacterium]